MYRSEKLERAEWQAVVRSLETDVFSTMSFIFFLSFVALDKIRFEVSSKEKKREKKFMNQSVGLQNKIKTNVRHFIIYSNLTTRRTICSTFSWTECLSYSLITRKLINFRNTTLMSCRDAISQLVKLKLSRK